MSASSKKKLRKEQEAAILTEKQQKEQKEAKKLKIYSIIFVAIMLAVAITGITVMAVKGVQNSGVVQKNTVAATVNDHEIDAILLNYYYYDTINSTYNNWVSTYGEMASAYIAMMGLDVTKPLDEQIYEGDQTWADYFLEVALDRVKADFTMYDLAMAENFQLTDEQAANVDTRISNNAFYALYGGYSNVKDYLRAVYGSGASEESFREYVEISNLANAYYLTFCDSVTFDDAALRAYEADKFDNYSSFAYDSYYMTYNTYLPEGTKDENGAVTYTDEEKEAARAALQVDADLLGQCTSTKELDEAIPKLAINASNPSATSTKNTNLIYTSVPSAIRDWIADEARVDGDMSVIPSYLTTNNEDGTENKELYGYYVVVFHSRNDNTDLMNNVRHLLVAFEKDEDGNVINKDEAKAEADGYLKTWTEGEATQDSFIELVKAHSDDSSASTGGLFEDIYPGSSYVSSFLNWSIDANRQEGDAEVIESQYGYHVMYYVGHSELSYRDSLITAELTEAKIDEWYHSVMENSNLVVGDTSFIEKHITLAA